MATERTFDCGYCGTSVTTTDPRKLFCNKKCADRNRNKARPSAASVAPATLTDLKGFGRLTDEAKKRILLGEEQFSVAMFDIEATHLKPNVGRTICVSIKPINEEPYTLHCLEKRFKKPDVYDDGALAIATLEELEQYDIIVGWNSKAFDYKFLNSRAVRVGGRVKVAQYHVDGMWSWRSKMSAWSGLNNAQRFALPGNDTEKTSIEWDKWMQVLGWDPKLSRAALDEIIDHCEKDVIVLEDVYKMLVEAGAIRSIRRDGGVL
jgi:uncharacterized protein YprB with RNaseH-like and TPR domain